MSKEATKEPVVDPDAVLAELAALEKKKQEAIQVLLKQREEITKKLQQLGFTDGPPPAKRGRKPKPKE
jgi:hypothetical protein